MTNTVRELAALIDDESAFDEPGVLQTLPPQVPSLNGMQDKVRLQNAYLKALIVKAGNRAAAARAIGVSCWRAYHWYYDDPVFKERQDKAMQIAYQVFEDEGIRRATEGVMTPIVSAGRVVMIPMKDADGNVLMDKDGKPQMEPLMKHEYSDHVWMRLAAANMPDRYAVRSQQSITAAVEVPQFVVVTRDQELPPQATPLEIAAGGAKMAILEMPRQADRED